MTPKEIAAQEGRQTYLGVVCKRGHSGIRYTVNADCVDCVALRSKTQERRQYLSKYILTEKHKVYQKEYQKQYCKTHIYKETKKLYAKNNKAKMAAKTRKYELSKTHRTPNWLTQDDFWLIEQAYELAAVRTKMFGFLWHVDHIVPLNGRLVSGLHVPHNLQVIPAISNQSKYNKFEIL